MLTSVACDSCDGEQFEPISCTIGPGDLAAWTAWMDAAILRVYESCGIPASMLAVVPTFDAAGAVVIRDIAEGE